MNCFVLSRHMAEELARTELDAPIVIISITNQGERPVIFHQNDNIWDVLPLAFNDTDRNQAGAMSVSDANRIAEFCSIWAGQAAIAVHCEAGLSRSAGVCAAILKHFNGSDWQIFGCPRYHPNMHCYREVLNAFQSLLPKTALQLSKINKGDKS